MQSALHAAMLTTDGGVQMVTDLTSVTLGYRYLEEFWNLDCGNKDDLLVYCSDLHLAKKKRALQSSTCTLIACEATANSCAILEMCSYGAMKLSDVENMY